MLNIFLWAGILVFSLASFNYTYMLGTVNRVFLGLYKAIPESSVIAYADGGKAITPYFDQILLRINVASYFKAALPKYVDTYHVNYVFTSAYTGDVCTGECERVGIEFSCTMLHVKSFHKTAIFTLERSSYE
jgi:hypothetical protein